MALVQLVVSALRAGFMSICSLALVTLGLLNLATPAAHAQAAPGPTGTAAPAPAPAAVSEAAPAAGGGISERVRQEAARPYYWIRLQANRGTGRPRSGAPAGVPPQPPGGTSLAGSAGAPTSEPAPATERRPTLTAEAAEALMEQAPPGTGLAPGTQGGPTTAGEGGLGASLATSSRDRSPLVPTDTPLPATPTESPLPWPEPAPVDLGQAPLLLLHQVEANFPAAWMQRLRHGAVDVAFVVGTDGSVGQVRVLRSSHRGLEAAAREAVAAWRFAPLPSPRDAVATLAFNVDQ